MVARFIQSLGQFDAAAMLDDPRWPLARPYRRVATGPGAAAAAAREAPRA